MSWQYTLRSSDGHIAQHVPLKDVAWHAGNWYVNAKSVGLEHEGFLASPDAWYTEAMYRSSARLVRYLAAKYGIPLDRQHILGHDNVPGPTDRDDPGHAHRPGPVLGLAHYFELLGSPFERDRGRERRRGDDPARTTPTNQPVYTGCVTGGRALRGARLERGAAVHRARRGRRRWSRTSVCARTASDSTTGVNDTGARASTGQQYAVAGREGDWTAIWYLGQKAWFQNPRGEPTAVARPGLVRDPEGRAWRTIPVYGRAYPEAAAYPAGVPVQAVSPLPYKLLAGQRYVAGDKVPGEYYYAVTFDTAGHKVVRRPGSVLRDPVRAPGGVRAGGGRAAAAVADAARTSTRGTGPWREPGPSCSRPRALSPAGTAPRAAA